MCEKDECRFRKLPPFKIAFCTAYIGKQKHNYPQVKKQIWHRITVKGRELLYAYTVFLNIFVGYNGHHYKPHNKDIEAAAFMFDYVLGS